MSIREILILVRASDADTLMAFAFRRAVGVAHPFKPGALSARVDRYQDASRLMHQRYGVRM